MMLVVARHLWSDGGICRRCRVNISDMPSRMLRAADSWSRSRKRASCSSRFSPFLCGFHLPRRPDQVQRLPLLLLGQFIKHVAKLVIAAALYGLLCAEHLLDSGPECLGA